MARDSYQFLKQKLKGQEMAKRKSKTFPSSLRSNISRCFPISRINVRIQLQLSCITKRSIREEEPPSQMSWVCGKKLATRTGLRFVAKRGFDWKMKFSSLLQLLLLASFTWITFGYPSSLSILIDTCDVHLLLLRQMINRLNKFNGIYLQLQL